MSIDLDDAALGDVLAVLPARADDLARLARLAAGGEPVVTVVGKYNHGKSSLLNELAGKPLFAVSDRRETVALAHGRHAGVRWLDAPGLDADVAGADDRHALRAVRLEADIRLFVHAAGEGELDARERQWLVALLDDDARSARRTFLVLSQIDQLADDAALARVAAALVAQVPAAEPCCVSSVRHRNGQQGGKRLLVERSGIPALQAALGAALERVPAARAREAARLRTDIAAQLGALRAEQDAALARLRERQRQQRDGFERGLRAVIDTVGADLCALLDSLGSDHASVPDTARDAYASTAGKRERARIQIAYSRACIEIDGFLAGHGVSELPPGRAMAAGSLHSVMIAVMGISVKFRRDLRRMFGEAAGRDRLRRDFTHYYELSADRVALASELAAQEQAVAATARAAAAIDAWRAGA
ncbi:GTPase [Burkholderia glumae]